MRRRQLIFFHKPNIQQDESSVDGAAVGALQHGVLSGTSRHRSEQENPKSNHLHKCCIIRSLKISSQHEKHSKQRSTSSAEFQCRTGPTEKLQTVEELLSAEELQSEMELQTFEQLLTKVKLQSAEELQNGEELQSYCR